MVFAVVVVVDVIVVVFVGSLDKQQTAEQTAVDMNNICCFFFARLKGHEINRQKMTNLENIDHVVPGNVWNKVKMLLNKEKVVQALSKITFPSKNLVKNH